MSLFSPKVPRPDWRILESAAGSFTVQRVYVGPDNWRWDTVMVVASLEEAMQVIQDKQRSETVVRTIYVGTK